MKNIKIIIVPLLTIVLTKMSFAQRFVPIPIPYHANNLITSSDNCNYKKIVIIATYFGINAFIILCYIARHFFLMNRKGYTEASFFEKTFYDIKYDYEDINFLTISFLTVNGIAILFSLIGLFTKILS